MTPQLIYIAGPYRAGRGRTERENVRAAEEVALEIWKSGHYALCPHLNTAFFTGEAPDDTWLAGDLRMIEGCDAVVLIGNWEFSDGTRQEIAHAIENGIPVYDGLLMFEEGKPIN